MQTNNKNENDNQINAAIAVNIQTAIALWEAKDWQTYVTTRDALLALIRSGHGGDIGIEQMQFIYFVNTHLRRRFAVPMADAVLFKKELPPTRSSNDKAWEVATKGTFWNDVM